MPIWPFKSPKALAEAEQLLAAVTAGSRQPKLYGAGRVPDTLEGRFELMTLCASLVLLRSKDNQRLNQWFVDVLFRQFDAGLREAAVGDTGVPKRMHSLAGAFYGRFAAYEAGLDGQASLTKAIGRNVLGHEAHPFASVLEAWARTVVEAPIEALHETQAWRFGSP
jgi:cytochrome b pre-mRNA-processing protein 3